MCIKRILFIISILIMVYSCTNTSNSRKDNPFFSEYTTPNGVPPFDKIKAEHYLPAFEEAMIRHNAEIDSIVNNTEVPTFKILVAALVDPG